MAVLKREEHIAVDISSNFVALTYTRPANATSAVVMPRIDLGVPTSPSGPVAGSGIYTGYALIDGHQVTPQSNITFVSGQTKGILQGRQITIEPGDVLTVEVLGLPGDTAVNVTAALHDATPLRTEDLEGITGSGSVPIDHNFGGADTYAYETKNGVGIDNALVYAYLSSDFNAGRRGIEYVKATSITDINGRWLRPMMLDPGSYVLYFFKQLAFGPDTAPLTVT